MANDSLFLFAQGMTSEEWPWHRFGRYVDSFEPLVRSIPGRETFENARSAIGRPFREGPRLLNSLMDWYPRSYEGYSRPSYYRGSGLRPTTTSRRPARYRRPPLVPPLRRRVGFARLPWTGKYKRYKKPYKRVRNVWSTAIPRPLNPISNFRKIVIKQVQYLRIPGTANIGSTETHNGVPIPCMKFCVTVQPFVVEAYAGTTRGRGCVMACQNGSNLWYSLHSLGPEYQPDLYLAVQRYASARVAALRVEMELFSRAHDPTNGSLDAWVKWPEMEITSAFDPFDNQLTAQLAAETIASAGAYHPVAPTAYEMKRMSYVKTYRQRFAPIAYVGIDTVRYPKKQVLLSRRFKPGKNSSEIFTASAGASDNRAIMSGDWDHSAIYDTNIGDAYIALQKPMRRAGKLYVDIRPTMEINSGLAMGETFDFDTTNGRIMGRVTTYHEIHLANDKDGVGKPQPAEA